MTTVMNKPRRGGMGSKDPHAKDRISGEVVSYKMTPEELEKHLKKPKEIKRRK